MATPPIDYAALAEQARKSAPVDYAALAEQARHSVAAPEAPPQFKPGFAEGVSGGAGMPSTPEELTAAEEEMKTHPLRNVLQGLLPASKVYEMAKDYVSTVAARGKQAVKEAYDAGKNIGEGQPVAPNIGKAALGAYQAANAAVPLVGEQANKVGEDVAKKNYSAAAGRAITTEALVGLGGDNAGAERPNIAPVTDAAAEGLYRRALKPSTANTPVENSAIVKTGLENKIPVSEAGATKLNGLINDLNQKIKAKIQAGANAGVTIDPNAVVKRLDTTRARFSNQVTPESDLAAIDATKEEFLRRNQNPIPADEAQQMKQGTYAQLRKKYGQLSTASDEAQKALAQGIKEELQTPFPEIKDLNASDGRLINLDAELSRAVNRIGNRNPVTFGGKVAGAAIATMAGGEIGHAAAAGMSALVLHEVLTNPTIQSRLAMAIYQGSKRSVPMATARARVAAYVTALNAHAQSSDDQATSQTK